jgi:hypothetical protein
MGNEMMQSFMFTDAKRAITKDLLMRIYLKEFATSFHAKNKYLQTELF